MRRYRARQTTVQPDNGVVRLVEVEEAALDALLRHGLDRVPGDEGGPGKEEQYWLGRKLNASVIHLRDIEDFYRLRGGLPEGHNMIRADRVRSLYEQISADFVNGKITTPTMRERAEAAEASLGEAENLIDRLITEGIEQWHTVTNDEPALHSWLGLTWKEYAAWVEGGTTKLLATRDDTNV